MYIKECTKSMYIKIFKALIIYLLFLTSIFTIKADILDTQKKGSIIIHYQYEDKIIEKANINLYKIANKDTNNNYIYLDSYKDKEKDISVMTSSELTEYAKEISNHITTNNISYNNKIQTDSNGIGSLAELDTGLYLLVFNKANKNNYEYNASPTLISLPSYNKENNSYLYDVDIYAKVEATTLNPNKETNTTGNTSNNNKTTERANNDVKKATEKKRKEDKNTTEDIKNDSTTTGSIKDNKDKETKINSTTSTPKNNNNIIIYIILSLLIVLGIITVVLYKLKKGKKERNEKNI